MDFLTKNKFDFKFDLKRQDIFENDVLSHSLYINEEYEILFIVQTNHNYEDEYYFDSKIYKLSNELHQIFGYGNCFYILNSKNYFYLIPFKMNNPESIKLNDFYIIEREFEIAKHDTILRRINNDYNNLESDLSDLIYKTNSITKHFYNYWAKYGDLKKFNYSEKIQIRLPRYIYEDMNFNINILEPAEIASPDKASDGYKYLMTSGDFKDYIKNRDEIVEVCRDFCIKHQLNFKIKNEENYYD